MLFWSINIIVVFTISWTSILSTKSHSRKAIQIDHRVPFEVDGEPELQPENFMLLCGSANRAKSWSCEHCQNWNNLKDKSICLSCYWAYPESYSHIAMRQVRRIDLLWQGKEVEIYAHFETTSEITQ